MNVFKLPRFYPIVDTVAVSPLNMSCVEVGRVLLEQGARILQYRHKASWTQLEYDEAARLAELCRRAEAVFILNDRADFASLLQCGVHVGQEDLPPAAVRALVGNAPIGYSTHNPQQLLLAAEEPVQYLAIGPVFTTVSKQNPSAELGLMRLRMLRELTTLPLVAIGGITLDTAPSVLATGVDSVAVIAGYLCEPASLAGKIREWLRV